MVKVYCFPQKEPPNGLGRSKAMFKQNERPKAFTIVEILVVIGIIAVLIGFLFPVLLRVSRVAKKAESMSRMRQISMWMGEYSSDNGDIILPSQFDYSDASLTPYPGKVRSIPQSTSSLTLSAGAEHQGTWTDILWTINNFSNMVAALPSAETDLGFSFRYDSPTKELYDYLDNDLTNPLRSAAFNSKNSKQAPLLGEGILTPFGTGADSENIPGFFAANDFFNNRPDVPGAPPLGFWHTNGQIAVPERSMYMVDSFYGEVIAATEEAYDNPSVGGSGGFSLQVDDPNPTGEVDFRYSGTCLMLFLDGHIENVGPWPDLTYLQEILRINVTNPLSSTP